MEIAKMFPGKYASYAPERPAVIMADGNRTVTYAQLEENSRRLAQLLHDQGLRQGDCVAIFSGCDERYFEVIWAVLRSGLYLVPINANYSEDEALYLVEDSDARVLIASGDKADLCRGMMNRAAALERLLVFDAPDSRVEDYASAISGYPDRRLEAEPLGDIMLYSSGTTGRPKGVYHPLSGRTVDEGWEAIDEQWGDRAGIDENTVCIVGGALYFAGPMIIGVWTQSYGGTVVVQEKFDAERTLQIIERHRVTHGFFVPTMFVRMLHLPDEVRVKYDLSSLKCPVVSAAPCAPEIKRQMIEWLGPIVEEYYAASEEHGLTWIDSQEWLERPGSVGRSYFGDLQILDDDGGRQPANEIGNVCFKGGRVFEYWRDPEKTENSRFRDGYATSGDIGYVDEEGYLYLVDRKDFTIISGGVNIYPKEIEDCLVAYPGIADVVVFGVPDPDFGEMVLAVVEPRENPADIDKFKGEILEFCRSRLAGYKCPKRVDLIDKMPRAETGKLKKKEMRDRYWQNTAETSQAQVSS